jgi:mRNA-degrading endonuclease RelE of RelBE toxin-antitoxin system
MSYKIIPTETFKTQVRTLQKKYPHIRQDLKDLSKRLKHNPKSGKALGKGVYKIRQYISNPAKQPLLITKFCPSYARKG